jgi:hypothetical protein
MYSETIDQMLTKLREMAHIDQYTFEVTIKNRELSRNIYTRSFN